MSTFLHTFDISTTDIANHFEYEKARGVEKISAMRRVMGGEAGFEKNSPTCILNNGLVSGEHLPNLTIIIDSKNDKIVSSEQSLVFGKAWRSSLHNMKGNEWKMNRQKVINISYINPTHSEFVTEWYPSKKIWNGNGRLATLTNTEKTYMESLHIDEFQNDYYIQEDAMSAVVAKRNEIGDDTNTSPFIDDILSLCHLEGYKVVEER